MSYDLVSVATTGALVAAAVGYGVREVMLARKPVSRHQRHGRPPRP
jgi:hypothetical protein